MKVVTVKQRELSNVEKFLVSISLRKRGLRRSITFTRRFPTTCESIHQPQSELCTCKTDQDDTAQ